MGAPVGNTCPDIDKVIEAIRASLISVGGIDNLIINCPNETEVDQIRYEVTCIENELYHVEGIMEELREANSKLRDWGEGLEEEVSSLEIDLSTMEEKYTDLIEENLSNKHL